MRYFVSENEKVLQDYIEEDLGVDIKKFALGFKENLADISASFDTHLCEYKLATFKRR